MRDTGLACYLAKIPDANILESSYLKGPMAETFIINEIMKTHSNRGLETPFFHFRASERTEIDLLMLYDGKINMIECKSGITISPSDAYWRQPWEKGDASCAPPTILIRYLNGSMRCLCGPSDAEYRKSAI